jgi:hypothetical protein
MIPIERAAQFLSYQAQVKLVPDRAAFIVEQYERYKNDIHKIDFEDMLTMGREFPLPVTSLLCDEVQDNSALLWSVIDAWKQSTSLTVMAGDPWQAIYLYMGAEPGLFRNRSGRWATIGNSHRLSAGSATYALGLLKSSGYAEDSLLSTWTGVGGTEREGGSRFFLARTNALLRDIREHLEDQGEPYRMLRGVGPLQMKAAAAYRQYRKEGLTNYTAHLIAEVLPPGTLPYGMKAELTRKAEVAPEDSLDTVGLWANAVERLPKYAYYERVVAKHGMSGMILQPATQVGTIHAAKGREADEVYLVRSWGRLPAMNMASSPAGRQSEACVAYVGATRHRTKLELLDTWDGGVPYPFPPIPHSD